MTSIISSVSWIAQGKCAQHPHRTNLTDDDEIARISALTGMHFQDAQTQVEEMKKAAEGMGQDDEWEDDDGSEDEAMSEDESSSTKSKTEEGKPAEGADVKMDDDPDDLARYKLDNYDDEQPQGTLGALSNIKGLTFYRNNDEDPYVTLKDDEDAKSDASREELEIYPSDNLIVVAKAEDEVPQLDAYVYAPEDANLYVHHDLMLPSFPLCLEWLDFKPAAYADDGDEPQLLPRGEPGAHGSYIAVGTMDPEIEIWSMDVVEAAFPDAILGRRDLTKDLGMPMGTGKKKRRQQAKRVANSTHHVDAVLGLSWNRVARSILASVSADKTVKLWDLTRPTSGKHGAALRSYDNVHSDKIQAVAWDTSGSSAGSVGADAAATLLTGSFDGSLRVFDTRSPEAGVFAKVASDVESVQWDPWHSNQFLASMENGLVQAFDKRNLRTGSAAEAKSLSAGAAEALWTLSAHESACTSIQLNPLVPGCLLTAGADRQTKLWSLTDAMGTGNMTPQSISMVTSRDLDAGRVFSASFSPNDPMTIACAGSKGVLRIWDALSNVGVRKTFGDRLDKVLTPQQRQRLEAGASDEIIKVADEGVDEEEDE